MPTKMNSDDGALLSVWDRLFASFHMRVDWQAVDLGLHGHDAPPHQSPAGLITTPFRN